MREHVWLTGTVVTIAAVLFGIASGEVIQLDNFDQPGECTETAAHDPLNWTLTNLFAWTLTYFPQEAHSPPCRLYGWYSFHYEMTSKPGVYDSTGYSNLTVSFWVTWSDSRGSEAAGSDIVKIYYKTDGGWRKLGASFKLSDTPVHEYAQVTRAVPADAANNPDLRFEIRFEVHCANMVVLLDDVCLEGDPIPTPTPTPTPVAVPRRFWQTYR